MFLLALPFEVASFRGPCPASRCLQLTILQVTGSWATFEVTELLNLCRGQGSYMLRIPQLFVRLRSELELHASLNFKSV